MFLGVVTRLNLVAKLDLANVCTWHGIDSLELYELTKVNDTALRIRSLF